MIDIATDVETLIENVRDLLQSNEPMVRLKAIHHLAAGCDRLERFAVAEARAAGSSWSEIGDVFGFTRQAAHQRFSEETIVSSAQFAALQELIAEGDEPESTVQNPVRAGRSASA